MAGKKKWFQKGEEGKKRADAFDKETKERRKRGAGSWRFRQDYDSAAKVVFLDNPEFFLSEHTVQKKNRTGKTIYTQETCIRDFDTCPLCEEGDNPSYVVVATVLDLRKRKDNQGREHKVTRSLFVGKGMARQALMRQVERREGDLTLCAFEIARGTQNNEPATGSDFDYIKRLTKAQAKKLIPQDQDETFLEPFDYEEILAPKSPKELRKLVGGESPVGSDEADDEEDLLTGDDDDGGVDDDESIEDLL